jgi:hypothetical protein
MLLAGTLPVWAQLDTGSIAGVVQDKSGAVISGATVKVTNTKTDRNWEVKTGSVGEYSVSGLPVGPYRVEVSHAGFKNSVVSNIVIHPAETPRADVILDVGSSGETVNVSADAATVNTTTSESGATIDANSVANLPLNGRDFTSLIALVPGSVTTGQFGQNSLGGFETSLAGVNVLLDGTDATRIDVNATSTQLGRQESRISRTSVDAIQEFKVMSGVYSAEYGRSTGDVVNVITKSGGNTAHGALFEYFRNDVLDAKNYFSTQKTPLRLNQFGGNLGGPIKKDKLFFFVNYEGVRQIVNVPTTAFVYTAATRALAVPSMQPVLAAVPLPNRPGAVTMTDSTGNTVVRNDLGYYDSNLRNELREDTGSIKLDYNASQSDTFSLRYDIADSDTSTEYGVATGQVSPSTSRNHLAKVTWNHTFASNWLNEFGVALNRPQTDSLGGGGNFPIFQCPYFFGFGCTANNSTGVTPGPALFSNRRPQHSLQYMDTMSWVKGRQQIRFGFDIRHNVTHDALDPQYFLAYLSISDFLNNNGFSVSTLGHTMVGVSNTNYGLFIQDDIRLTPRFTVNLGLRYEYNTVLQGDQIGNFDIATLSLMPQGAPLYNPDRNNFAPRVGVSWDPFGTGKTVIRAGGGIFYNPLLTGAALSLAGNYQQSFSVNIFDLLFGTRSCNPPLTIAYPLPATLPTCTPALPASVNALDQNMRDTYSGHWSFGIQQEIMKDTVMELSYVGNRGIKLPAGAAYAGLELNYDPFGGPNKLSPNYGNIRRLGNFLDSNYNSFQASVRRRVSSGLTLDANYTWSHELDDAVNILLNAFQNSNNPGGDYGDGDIDVRHNFTVGAVYDMPVATWMPKRLAQGWQISTLFQTRSGLPVNIANAAPFLGIDELRPDRVPGVSIQGSGAPYNILNRGAFTTAANGYGDLRRNAGRGPGFAQLDLGLSKTTKINERLSLQLMGQMFNLLNHPNFANPSGYLDDLNFGRSTSTVGNHVGTGTSRQAQLALKLIF